MKRAWSREMPAVAGWWFIKCMETEHKPQRVRIYKDVDDELWIDDPDVGRNPLKFYHDNMCDVRWRRA